MPYTNLQEKLQQTRRCLTQVSDPSNSDGEITKRIAEERNSYGEP